jgi:hypothetical protein
MACTPKFMVVDKTPNGIYNGCTAIVVPLNQRAERLSQVFITKDNKGKTLRITYSKNVLIYCDEYNVGDTLLLTRKKYTNRKIKFSEKYMVFVRR